MSRATKPPRVVAELGRPETPEETAARKAENSRLYRARKTVNNLVFSLLATVGLVLVIVLVVPRGDTVVDHTVDAVSVAETTQLGIPQELVVPALDATWKANAAELRGVTSDVRSWYIGYLTPGEEFIALNQGLDANPTWVAEQLKESAASGVETIDGIEWTIYDNRGSSRDVGNVEYGMTAVIDPAVFPDAGGASDLVLFGTAAPGEFRVLASAIAAQLAAPAA